MTFKFPPEKWEVLVDPERKKWQDVSEFLEVANPSEDEVWVDIGCGPGYFALPLAKLVKKVYAVDIEESMLEKCRLRAKDEKITNIDFIKCTEEEIPVPDDSADRILLANVFHELLNREAIFDEIKRIMKKEGKGYIIDWHPVESPAGPPIEERVPVEEVVSFLEANNFKDIKEYNVYPYHYLLEFTK